MSISSTWSQSLMKWKWSWLRCKVLSMIEWWIYMSRLMLAKPLRIWIYLNKKSKFLRSVTQNQLINKLHNKIWHQKDNKSSDQSLFDHNPEKTLSFQRTKQKINKLIKWAHRKVAISYLRNANQWLIKYCWNVKINIILFWNILNSKFSKL